MSPESQLTGTWNSTRTNLAVASAVLLLFVVANILIGPLMARFQPSVPEAAMWNCLAGMIGEEGGLHAIWCVLAPVSFFKRLAVGIGAGAILFGAWALGYAIGISQGGYLRGNYWETVRTGLLCLPLLAIAIQSPLWIARGWLGWRILYGCDTSAGLRVERIRIGDLLTAMAVVAMALSAVRWGKTPSQVDSLLPLVIAAAAISLFTTLPVVVAILRSRRLWLALTAALLPYLTLLLADLVGARLRSEPVLWQAWANFASMLGAFFVCMAGAMLLVRRLGFRLFLGRRYRDYTGKGRHC